MYDNLGLNSKLQSPNSLANRGTFTSAFDFYSSSERGAVRSFSIGNFSFNAGTGGTITFTVGTSNGYIRIDGGNSNIIVNDGTTDRVGIGFV